MKSIILILSILFSLNSLTQTTDWELYNSVDGVNIYQRFEDCLENRLPDQRAVILKVENTNDYDVTVDWDVMIWYNDKLITTVPQNPEHHHSTLVTKNSSTIGSCDEPRGALYIMEKFIVLTNTHVLTQFELDRIEVKKN